MLGDRRRGACWHTRKAWSSTCGCKGREGLDLEMFMLGVRRWGSEGVGGKEEGSVLAYEESLE